MITIAAVDNFLTEQGQFCLVDWLLAEGYIAYVDYEAWRYGQQFLLTSTCALDTAQLQQLTQLTEKISRELKLQREPQDYYSWGSTPVILTLCDNKELHALLAARWLARRDIPQLDLFMDNSAAIAENQLLDALTNRQTDNAQHSLQQLSKLNPQHPKLGGYQNLVIYALHCKDNPEVPEDSFDAEWQGLLNEVAPQSKELLGSKSRDYLAVPWRRLASARQLFPAEQFTAEVHASFAYAQIPDWAAVVQSLENEPSLFTHPQLSARLAEAYWQQKKINAFYLIWGLLFDRHPEQAETLLNKKHRPLIEAWDDFLAFDDDWLPQEFLGYLLIRFPQLTALLMQAPAFKTLRITHPANCAAADLMAAYANTQDEKSPRENVQNTSPSMLRYYLSKVRSI